MKVGEVVTIVGLARDGSKVVRPRDGGAYGYDALRQLTRPRLAVEADEMVDHNSRVTFRSVVKDLVPPLLVRMVRPSVPDQFQYHQFSAPYPSWAAASTAAEGYGAPQILAKVRDAALKVKRGEFAYEQDSILSSVPSYKWEMLACLMSAMASSSRRPAHVIDFGGSLGSLYYRHRPFIGETMWSIVEQATFVDCGNREFADKRLKFYPSLTLALERGPADVILCAGVLQIIEQPFELLRAAAKARIPFLLIDRLPLYDIPADAIVVLTAKETVYKADLPYHQFAKDHFDRQLTGTGWEIMLRYEHDRRFGLFCRLLA